MKNEVVLWRAVIYNAFDEAQARDLTDNQYGVRWETYARQSRAWLLGLGPDFKLVCEMAGYSPDYVRRKAREMAAKGWPRPDYHPQYT